jgi:hypothetical protein
VSAVRRGVECLAAVVDAARPVAEVIPDPLIAAARFGPVTVAGERDDPESALAALLTALASIGIITDTTEETGA